MHETTMRNITALQQLPIACQHDAMLVLRDGPDLLVAIVVAVEGIEAEHAQQPGEASQMRVGDEAQLAQRFAAKLEQRAYIEALELGIDADVIAVTHCIAQVDRLAVSKD